MIKINTLGCLKCVPYFVGVCVSVCDHITYVIIFCCGNESFALNSTRILNNFKTIENYRFECGMWNELIY